MRKALTFVLVLALTAPAFAGGRVFSVLMGRQATTAGGGNAFWPITGTCSAMNATEANIQLQVLGFRPMELGVGLSAIPNRTDGAWQWTVRNGADMDWTCTVASAGTTCSDVSGTGTINTGAASIRRNEVNSADGSNMKYFLVGDRR